MNLVTPSLKPPAVPQGTLVLTPAYAITALASGLAVEVRARPARRELPQG